MSLSIRETVIRLRGITLSHQILLLLHAAGGALIQAQVEGRLIWFGHELNDKSTAENVRNSLDILLSLDFVHRDYRHLRAYYLTEAGEDYVTLKLMPKLSDEQAELFCNARFQPAFAPKEWKH